MSKKIIISKMGRLTGAVCLTLSLGATMVAQAADTTFAFVSAKDNYWKEAAVNEGSGGTTVTVKESDEKQVFRGLAGTFNEAGWEMLKMLSEAERDSAMKLLFDKNNGIGFEWGRIPIGASDYALTRYSLCDASSDDFTMSNFSVARDKDTLMQYIKWAQAINPDIHFWASPWTPPPWMKENTISDPRGKGYDGGVMRNSPNVFEAYALYFSKFIKAYGEEGIKVSAVCPQNEPGYTREYPTCGWGKYNDQTGNDVDGSEYLSTFVADYLYPKLQSDNPETEIWFGTLSNNKSFSGYWDGMKQKLGSKAHDVIKGLGFQWNNVDRVAPNVNDGYFVFCSEHQCGNYYWKTEVTNVEQADSTHWIKAFAPNNYNYGVESWDLMKRWIRNGTHLYSAWNMVLDEKGMNLNWNLEWPQNALLVVDRSTKKLKTTAYYYVMRHIGQYVDSGAVLLGTQGGDALAFKNPDGSFVVALANTGSKSDFTISLGGKNYKFEHPGNGWATFYTGPNPYATATKDIAHTNATVYENSLNVTRHADGYRIDLPSQEAGHVELLTLAGKVLESKAIRQGSSSVQLQKQSASAGMLLVRVTTGNNVRTARIMNAR